MRLWTGLFYLLGFIRYGQSVDCYLCSADLRKDPSPEKSTCIFPPKENKGRTSCNSESKYCKGTITRINGALIQIQRTCEEDCRERCKIWGFGMETVECTFCCNQSIERAYSCGFQGYKVQLT